MKRQNKRKRAFPRRCGSCGEKAVVLAQLDYMYRANGHKYIITVPGLEVLKCGKCGEMAIPRKADLFPFPATKALRAKATHGKTGCTRCRTTIHTLIGH